MNAEIEQIMTQRFGKDSLIALATVEDGIPSVRTVDAVYLDGSFYTVTYALSGKMQHIGKNPQVAVCGEWFSGHGVGENLGHVRREENREIMDILRKAFALWYDNGHTNEEDPNTILLRIRLRDGVLFSQGQRYGVQWSEA